MRRKRKLGSNLASKFQIPPFPLFLPLFLFLIFLSITSFNAPISRYNGIDICTCNFSSDASSVLFSGVVSKVEG